MISQLSFDAESVREGGFIDTTPHLGVKFLQNRHFGGVKSNFKPNKQGVKFGVGRISKRQIDIREQYRSSYNQTVGFVYCPEFPHTRYMMSETQAPLP